MTVDERITSPSGPVHLSVPDARQVAETKSAKTASDLLQIIKTETQANINTDLFS